MSHPHTDIHTLKDGPEQPMVNPNGSIHQRESIHKREYTRYRYAHKENLHTALICFPRALQDYIDAFDAIPNLSVDVMRWKAVATPEERAMCASMENSIVTQVHSIQERGLPLG